MRWTDHLRPSFARGPRRGSSSAEEGWSTFACAQARPAAREDRGSESRAGSRAHRLSRRRRRRRAPAEARRHAPRLVRRSRRVGKHHERLVEALDVDLEHVGARVDRRCLEREVRDLAGHRYPGEVAAIAAIRTPRGDDRKKSAHASSGAKATRPSRNIKQTMVRGDWPTDRVSASMGPWRRCAHGDRKRREPSSAARRRSLAGRVTRHFGKVPQWHASC
jgi:hypothetical protein